MKRLVEYLSRFRRGGPPVRVATGGDAAAIVELALDFCRERGRRIAPGAEERFARFAGQLLGCEQATLLVTEEAGRITGMVCGQLVPPDLWDDRTVYVVDWLYVIPERRNGRTALALLRGALSCARRRGARRVRISAEADQPRLQRRYQREFGFVPERTSYLINVREEETWGIH